MKNKFLENLKKELYFFDESEINDVISSYEEIIAERINAGEKSDDIIMSFDKPKEIAAQFAIDQNIKTNSLKKIQANTHKSVKSYIIKLKEVEKTKQSNSKTNNSLEKNYQLLSIITQLLKFIKIVVVNAIKTVFVLQIVVMISGYIILLLTVQLEQNTSLFFLGLLLTMISLTYIELYIYKHLKKQEF